MDFKKYWQSIALLAAICLSANIALAAASSSENYTLVKDTLNGGGLAGASADYDLEASLGQAGAIGASSGTDYGIDAGFQGHLGELGYILTVTLAGGGSGTVISDPAGIDCGSSCTASYDPGTLVTLTAVADGDSVFTGWSGDSCSGTDPCQITMDSNAEVTATFAGPPAITTQPQSQTKWTGQSATFSVVAEGDGTLTYQWRKDGTDISGADSDQFTVDPVALGDTGDYTCVVSNLAGDTASDPATLTVKETVHITSQPESQSVVVGGAVTFSVTAQGTAPITYQWKKDGTDLTGETGADLTIGSAALSDAGNYTCTAANGGGSVTSDQAILTVIQGFTITASAGAGGAIDPSGQVPVNTGDDQAFLITPDATHLISQVLVDGNPIDLPDLQVGQSYTYTFQNVVQDHAIAASFTGPPTITTQPQSQTKWTGQSATFSVAAEGTGTLTYQWRKDGDDISGATSDQYTIDQVSLADAGTYTCVVSNQAGDTTSDPATLTVNETVHITSQPESRSVAVGDSVTFAVTAQGTAPITYQWKKDGQNLSGKTGADLTITNATLSDAGSYTCVVTNGGGSVTSDQAVLTVIQGFTITASAGAGGTIVPSGLVAVETGADQAFVITPDATHSISQILVDGNPIDLPDLPVGAAYTHTFTNVTADHTIAASFEGPPTIITQPQSQTRWTGQSATFSVAAEGTGTLTYQWRKGGNDLSGATGNQYTIDQVSLADAGSYTCVVSNQAGGVTSDPAVLTVNETVHLTSQPQSQTVLVGGTVTFAVTAQGAAPITYQWKKDGQNLSGKTGADLTITNATLSDAGSYTCVVTNGGGSVTSDQAVLTVIQGFTITASAGAGGTIVPSGEVPVETGADQAFVITPDATHSISQILVDGSPIDLPDLPVGAAYTHTFTNVTADHTIATSFEGPPTITTQPQSQTKWTGQSATFSVAAEGTGTLTYQWRKGGDDLSGATSDQYTIDPVTLEDAGSYTCLVTNPSGSTLSDEAALTVKETVSLTGQPQSQTVFEGESVVFSVTTQGTEPITYQWQKDDQDLSGETGAQLTIDPVAVNHAGTYTCVVSNGGGTLTSDPAVLTVLQGFTITATAGPGGIIEPSGEVMVEEGADQVFTITPEDHYFILQILVDGNPLDLPDLPVGTAFTHTFTNVTADHTIAASFGPENVTLTLSVAGQGEGTTDPAVGEYEYDYGTEVTIEAFPGNDSLFGGWSGDAAGTDNPLTLIMTGSKNITANFFVDTTDPPRATLVNLPPQLTNAVQYNINVGGIGVKAYKWKLDDGNYSAQTPVTTTLILSVASEGRHTLQVLGRGLSEWWQPEDNPTTYSWTIDHTPPTATLNNYPRGEIGNDAIEVFVGGANVRNYKYRLDEGNDLLDNGFTVFYPVSKPIRQTGLAPGAHSLEVIGEDLAGNWQNEDETTRIEWTVNPDIPTAVFSGLPATLTNETSTNIQVNGVAGGVEIDGYNYALDQGNWVFSNAEDPIAIDDLTEGTHTLYANAHGNNGLWQSGGSGTGKTSATTYEWEVDLTPPAAPTLAVTRGDPPSTSAFLSWNSVENDQKRYVLKYSFPRADSSKNVTIDLFQTPGPEGTQETFQLTGLTPATLYQFSIKSLDAAGNKSDFSSPAQELTTADLCPKIESFGLTENEETSGVNDRARELKVTGQHFCSGAGNCLVRFQNIRESFDLSSKGGSQTEILVDVPQGAPVGVYHLRVINKNGVSALSGETYEVLIASPPRPEVTRISTVIARNDEAIQVVIKGSHFTGAVSAQLVPAKGSQIVDLTGLTVVDENTLEALVPAGIEEDIYQIRVETLNGANQVSAAQYEVYAPVDLTGSQNPLSITKPILTPGDGVVPITLTLSTDSRPEIPQSNSTDMEIEAGFEAGTQILDENGAPYNGTVDPPRQIPVEGLSDSLDETALAFTMGADQRLNLADGRTITVLLEISLPGSKSDPVVYYVEADGSLAIAGVAGEKSGIHYQVGGTILNTRFNTPETGYTTFTMGLLLDHMSTLAVASQDQPGPTITSLNPDRGSTKGGDEVTITGANFLDGANLEIDGQDTEFILVDAQTITFITPAHGQGAVDVTVVNPDDQTATLANGFTFQKDEATPSGGGCGGGGCFLTTLP